MGELRVLLYAGAALALIAGLKTCHDRIDAAGYDRAKAEDRSAMEQQAGRNRELQRQSELRYVVKRDTQERFFVTTVREIRDASAPLAACPVPDAVRLRLNAAAGCARGDPAATCGAAGTLPDAR